MSAPRTAMLGYTAVPCTRPARRGPCSGIVMPHAAAACPECVALLGRRWCRPLARAAVGGTLRERHTLIGQTLLLRIGERRTRTARVSVARSMLTGGRGRQSARFRRGAERGSLLVGGRGRPLPGPVGRGTLRERHTLIGQTLLLRIGERGPGRAGALLTVGSGRGGVGGGKHTHTQCGKRCQRQEPHHDSDFSGISVSSTRWSRVLLSVAGTLPWGASSGNRPEMYLSGARAGDVQRARRQAPRASCASSRRTTTGDPASRTDAATQSRPLRFAS